MVIGLAVVASLVVGFLAGLLTFKRSERWCPQHGTTKVCLLCERSGLSVAVPGGRRTR
jgi:hypothetical protein